jgi:hypothetical protein
MPASASFLSLGNRQKRLAASVTEVLDTIAGQEGEDGSVPETDAVSLTKADTQPSERTADTPIPAAPTSSGSVLPAAGADAEIARLQADIEDLRRERHIQVIAGKGRIAWQRDSGYNERARVEGQFAR